MAVVAVILRRPAQPPIPDGGQPETNPSALRKSDLAWLIFGLWGTSASGVPLCSEFVLQCGVTRPRQVE